MKLINKLALMSATSCKAVKRIHLAPENKSEGFAAFDCVNSSNPCNNTAF
jgi:hypothetical protein